MAGLTLPQHAHPEAALEIWPVATMPPAGCAPTAPGRHCPAFQAPMFWTTQTKRPCALTQGLDVYCNFGSPTWARTRDLRINSPALYQLSYRGTETKIIDRNRYRLQCPKRAVRPLCHAPVVIDGGPRSASSYGRAHRLRPAPLVHDVLHQAPVRCRPASSTARCAAPWGTDRHG